MSFTNPSARTFALALLSLAAASCASHRNDHPYLHEKEQTPPAQWSYEGATGPEHWGDLCPEYVLAKTGRMQSPIDIAGAQEADLPAIQFSYHPTKIDLVYNGHTVEEKDDKESSIEVGGKTFVLQQFHFHSPSEHTIDGRHSDMEMHLVHKSDDGQLAVVSVMLRSGAENAAFAPIWGDLPTDANRTKESEVVVDPAKLLPANRAYYRYDGSLTTPPCSEGVLWLVMKTPVELSPRQISAFRAVIDGNNRPVQPLNGRKIATSK